MQPDMGSPRARATTPVPRPPGRPRSARADRAILRATLELLAEAGIEGLTMEGIAERAGVGKATLYRRWTGREEVVAAAVEGFVSEITIPDTGTIEGDLLHLMRHAVALYKGRPGRIMPGLVSAMAHSDALARTVRDGFLAHRRTALRTVLERAVRRGELRCDADLELALDFLGGPLFYRLLVTGGPLDDELARGVVDVMLRGMAAAPRTPDHGRQR